MSIARTIYKTFPSTIRRFSFATCINNNEKERQQFDLIAARINVPCTIHRKVKHGRFGPDSDLIVYVNGKMRVHIEGSHLKEGNGYRKERDVQKAFEHTLLTYAYQINTEDFLQLWIQFGGMLSRESYGHYVDLSYKVLYIPRTVDHFTPADYKKLNAFLLKYGLRRHLFNRKCDECEGECSDCASEKRIDSIDSIDSVECIGEPDYSLGFFNSYYHSHFELLCDLAENDSLNSSSGRC